MAETQFDLIVIGAGPGGYVAAIRAAQLGFKVACIDRQFLGGTCLNIGCIPSKAWLDSSFKFYEATHALKRHGINAQVSLDLPAMAARKDQVVKGLTTGVGFLFKKNKVTAFMADARLTSPSTVQIKPIDGSASTELHGKRILIATGSAPIELPGLPFDGQHIISSTEALSLPEVPKRLIVVGAGAIGLELGSVWNRLGSQVTVLEFMDRILPGMDRDITTLAQRALEKQGLRFKLQTSAKGAKIDGGIIHVNWAGPNESGVEECDRLLVAVGRKPYTASLGLGEIGVQTNPKGFIPVNKQFATNMPGVYAIGDVIGGPMLAHKAEEEGVAAVEMMAGHAAWVNYRACPNVVYTHPEVAQVGYTEDDARAAGHELRIGKFPLTANGRARSMDDTEGMVKIIGDAKTDRLLGVHIMAAHASDMIAEAALAIEFAASVEDIARAFHAHPTLAEAVKESALAADGRAIHI